MSLKNLQFAMAPQGWQSTVSDAFCEPRNAAFGVVAEEFGDDLQKAKVKVRLSEPFQIFGGKIAENSDAVFEGFSVVGWRCVVFKGREPVAFVDLAPKKAPMGKSGAELALSGVTRGEALQSLLEALGLALHKVKGDGSRFEIRCLDLLGISVSALWITEASGDRSKDLIITRGPAFHRLAKKRVWGAVEFAKELVGVAERRKRAEEELLKSQDRVPSS